MSEFHDNVSEATRIRCERAEFEYRRAKVEWQAAWLAYQREAYSRSAMDDAKSDAEGISADAR